MIKNSSLKRSQAENLTNFCHNKFLKNEKLRSKREKK